MGVGRVGPGHDLPFSSRWPIRFVVTRPGGYRAGTRGRCGYQDHPRTHVAIARTPTAENGRARRLPPKRPKAATGGYHPQSRHLARISRGSPTERGPPAPPGRQVVFGRSPLDAQKMLVPAVEVVHQARSGQAEGEVDRPSRVAIPVTMFTRAQGRSYVLDDARDRIAGVPGQPEAQSDLRVDTRRIRATSDCIASSRSRYDFGPVCSYFAPGSHNQGKSPHPGRSRN
jgi:hypothetical protein